MSRIQARFQLDYPEFSLAVELDLPGRGVTALFGHSGSGKTTLLRLIAGLIQVRDGHLTVNGEVWQEGETFRPTHQRPLGYVFQEASLFPHLTARGNLAYGMKRVGNAMDRQALEQAVELLGIAHLLDRRPHQLSGGERQRVAIARALALHPKLLLMDEPLAALDLKRKQEILPYLERLHDALDIPVLYVSHAPDEVARLADTVVLLEQGRVRAQGTVTEVFSRLDLALAQDQGASTLIECTVAGHDDEDALTRVTFAGGHLWLGRLQRPLGARVRVRIHARDVSLALVEPTSSTILNILPARIQELREIEPAQVLVKLALGEAQDTTLLARITRLSANRLGLQVGLSVFAQVKTVALMD
ncbi:molybdenum ABC transporter ATP-binding protein [Allochromatium tepidum]|uniref:Molybdenum import ATP-binding protein ModC n=1 Tax=Allochromatium tepidum TaxID=553982 RepID=A0ABN6G938_9GAMM|nr:molybdenum ABC transporter ATP-binding protein [Allochromatium tepidum]BCU06427.1 molybdenum import ATP-binding protein ModC [Allochromatium tepidum]